jgi:hypothetical protein
MWIAGRVSWRRALIEGFAFTTGAAIMLGPLLRSVRLESLFERSLTILVFRSGVTEWLADGYQASGTAAVVWKNLLSAAGMFIDWADVCILNRSPGGLLDGATLAALIAGGLVALMSGQLRALFLVLWVTVVFVFGVALTDAPRASYRLGPAMPALFLLAGFGTQRLFFSERPRHWWQRWVIWPLVIGGFSGWIAYTNYTQFFVAYSADGDGREFALPAALRLVGDDCDGRQFYWLSGDQARQSDLFELFCPQFRALDEEDIPRGLDRTRAATFIVMRPWPDALARLKSCFPDANTATVRARDHRFLFLRVDVSAAEVVAAPESCPIDVAGDGQQADGAARRRRGRSAPFDLD